MSAERAGDVRVGRAGRVGDGSTAESTGSTAESTDGQGNRPSASSATRRTAALETAICCDEPAVTTVWVRGEIDAATADEFAELLTAVPDCTLSVCLDLREVSFFGAAGCGVLALFLARISAAGQRPVRLLTSRSVREVLTICKLDELYR